MIESTFGIEEEYFLTDLASRRVAQAGWRRSPKTAGANSASG